MYKYFFYPVALLPKSLRRKFIKKLATYFLQRYADFKIEGLDNIPKKGPVIFMANHLSNADGLIFYLLLAEMKNVVFVAGEKLKDELITSLMLDIIPHITIKPNKPDRKALRSATETLKSGNSLFIFPEGTRSRSGELLKGRSGVVLIAKQSKAPIIPVGIWGTENLLPVNTGGKMSREWFKKAEVHVSFGKEFSYEDINYNNNELVDNMMLKIAELLPEKYQGYYSLVKWSD